MSSTDATVIAGADLPPADAPAIDGVSIERELGRGGMGAVWLGRQTYLDRAVAVKALTLAGDEAFAARFRREARILAGLSHPHIVACHQAGMAPDGRPFLVMEFVDGPDLKKHVAAHGPLPPAEAARLVAEVAEGLRHAHAQGIIHRDVKPENVLLAKRPDGALTAKLADLGLARTVRVEANGLTAAGQVLGTPATMAPEQFDDPDSVDERADIYGLGCVLHHALTGGPAFSGRSFAELVASKVHGPPPDPAQRRPGLPPALAGLCRRMLARDRAERPGYDELIAALRAPMAARRRLPIALLAGAAVVVIAVVAVIVGQRPAASAQRPTASAQPPAASGQQPAVGLQSVSITQQTSAGGGSVTVVALPPTVRVVPEPAAAPRLAAPLPLFGADFDKRLAGWNIADPLAWGVSEDVEGSPVAGRSGEIVRPLPGTPGRILGTVTVPEDASNVLVGVRDADGITTGLRLLPLNGLIASLVRLGADGADRESAGSATMAARRARFTLVFADGRLTATLRDAAVPKALVMAMPSPPVAVVLSVEGASAVLFSELRAEP